MGLIDGLAEYEAEYEALQALVPPFEPRDEQGGWTVYNVMVKEWTNGELIYQGPLPIAWFEDEGEAYGYVHLYMDAHPKKTWALFVKKGLPVVRLKK